MKFGNPLGRVPKPKGKGGGQQMLPSRQAVSQLTGGTPEQRSLNNYAKLTPSGAGAPMSYPAIMNMAEEGDAAASDE